jgi:hypothetical protein
MKISELIRQLQAIEFSEGDLDVEITLAQYYEGDTNNAERAIVTTDHEGKTVVGFQ